MYNYLNIIFKFIFKLFYLMIFFETTCFEFPCVAGSHFPKVRGSFSESRWLIFPKAGGSFSQKSVTDFPKIGAHFPKVGR